MRKCPFCAEDVQDAARVCKHCGRKLATASSKGVGRLWMLFGLLAGVLITIGAVTVRQRAIVSAQAAVDSAKAESRRRATADSLQRVARARSVDSATEVERRHLNDSIRDAAHERAVAESIAAAKPLFIPIANDAALEIPAPTKRALKFVVPQTTKNCKVVGRVRGLAGGNKDVAVYLMTDDQFVAWSNNSANPHSSWQAWKGSEITLDYQLYGAGTYYLIISNAFSAVTSKTVEIQAQVKCTNEPRPVIRE